MIGFMPILRTACLLLTLAASLLLTAVNVMAHFCANLDFQEHNADLLAVTARCLTCRLDKAL